MQDPLSQIVRPDDDHTTLHFSAKSLQSLGLHGPSNWFMLAKRFDGKGASRGRTILGKGNKDKDKDKKKGNKTKGKGKEGKGNKDQDKDKKNDDKTKGKGKEDKSLN